jgi:hypothetical protein
MAHTITRYIAIIPALPMLMIGIGLIFEPELALASLNMPLLDGLALSTQLGDMISFFLCTGAFIFMGAIKAEPRWLYAGAALFTVAALARLLAWLVHGADLAVEPIAVEVISTIWLIVCAGLVKKQVAAATTTS